MTKEEKESCEHDASQIKWRKYPDLHGDFDAAIPWYGRCECGVLVYQLYHQDDEIFLA